MNPCINCKYQAYCESTKFHCPEKERHENPPKLRLDGLKFYRKMQKAENAIYLDCLYDPEIMRREMIRKMESKVPDRFNKPGWYTDQ